MRFHIIHNDYPESISLAKDLNEQLSTRKGWNIDEQNPEVIFSIGGDGTFLKAVQKFHDKLDQVKFLPIKSGNVGFYTRFNHAPIDDNFLKALDEKTFKTIQFPMLQIQADDQKYFAINEVKLVNATRPLTCTVAINGETLETFKGTGLVFATATGTSGFAKTTGGALIYPDAKLYEMLELSPVNNRHFTTINAPIIFNQNQKVQLTLSSRQTAEQQLVIDAFNYSGAIKSLTVELCDEKLTMITLDQDQIDRTILWREIFVKN